MADATRKPDASRRSRRSRDAILAATMDLLGEVGYDRLTMEAIAARAGAGKQTIYRWWSTKRALVLEAFRHLNASQDEALELPDTGDIDADLKVVMRGIADEGNDPRYEGPTRALIAESQHDTEFAEEARDTFLMPGMRATKDRLRLAREAGQVRADADLDLVVELLFGSVHHRWLHRTAPITHEYTDRIVEYALAAVRP